MAHCILLFHSSGKKRNQINATTKKASSLISYLCGRLEFYFFLPMNLKSFFLSIVLLRHPKVEHTCLIIILLMKNRKKNNNKFSFILKKKKKKKVN